MNNVKILIYDIESSPILAWVYRRYEANVVRVEKEQTIMSFSYKWYGEKKVRHENIQDQTEAEMLAKLRDIMDEADIIIGHNSIRFDNRMVNAAFIKHGIAPPSPYKNVDTLRVAKNVGMFSSNKLNDLGELFGIGTKTQETYASLWYDALVNRDPKAWAKMKKYNNQDVNLTERLYETLRPYQTNHPNFGDLTQIDGLCTHCSSSNLEKRGFSMRRAGRVQRYQCKDCGGWCNAATIKKPEGRLVNGV